VSYWIALANEIPGYAGNGKDAILRLYRLLRGRNSLISQLGRKKTGVLFFLDKDIDDILRTRARSAHVTYTQYYGVENYLYRFGNLCDAVVYGAQLDHTSVSIQLLVRGTSWTENAARSWKDWVVFCLFASANHLGVPNYGHPSRIHTGAYTAHDPNRLAQQRAAALTASGLPQVDFDQRYARAQAQVDRHFANGELDKVFNGKWYSRFLVADANIAANGRQFNSANLSERLRSGLLMSLDFHAPWATHFHTAIRSIAAQL
jgi:hypothetical protein